MNLTTMTINRLFIVNFMDHDKRYCISKLKFKGTLKKLHFFLGKEL